MSSKQMFKRLLKAIGFTLFCVFLVLAGYLLHVWFLGNCTIISHDFERERPVPPITNVSFVGSFVAIGDGESIAGAGVFIRYVRTNVYASDPPIHHVIVSAENVFRKLDPSGGNAPVTLSLHFPDTKKNRWIPIAVTGTVYYSKDSDSKYANPFALIEIPETSLPNEKDFPARPVVIGYGKKLEAGLQRTGSTTWISGLAQTIFPYDITSGSDLHIPMSLRCDPKGGSRLPITLPFVRPGCLNHTFINVPGYGNGYQQFFSEAPFIDTVNIGTPVFRYFDGDGAKIYLSNGYYFCGIAVPFVWDPCGESHIGTGETNEKAVTGIIDAWDIISFMRWHFDDMLIRM